MNMVELTFQVPADLAERTREYVMEAIGRLVYERELENQQAPIRAAAQAAMDSVRTANRITKAVSSESIG